MWIIFLLEQTEHVPTGFLSEAVCSLSPCSCNSMDVRVLKVFKRPWPLLPQGLCAGCSPCLGSSFPTCRGGSSLALLLTGNIAWAELFSPG